MRMLKCS